MMKSNSEKAGELALIGGIISILVSLVLFVSLQFSYNIIIYLFVAMFYMGTFSIIISFFSGIIAIVISLLVKRNPTVTKGTILLILGILNLILASGLALPAVILYIIAGIKTMKNQKLNES